MKRKKIEKAISEAKETDFDGKGNAVISVGLKRKEDFYNPYCDKTYKMLNSEMLDYIEANAKALPRTKDIAIEIFSETELSKTDKEQMQDAIKRQFAEELVHQKKRLNRNIIATLLLTIVGLGVLALGIFLENIKISSILSNTVMIAAWVFLWEAVDIFFLRRPSLSMKYRLLKKLISCDVRIKQY